VATGTDEGHTGPVAVDVFGYDRLEETAAGDVSVDGAPALLYCGAEPGVAVDRDKLLTLLLQGKIYNIVSAKNIKGKCSVDKPITFPFPVRTVATRRVRRTWLRGEAGALDR
jgi:hypothetical protein